MQVTIQHQLGGGRCFNLNPEQKLSSVVRTQGIRQMRLAAPLNLKIEGKFISLSPTTTVFRGNKWFNIVWKHNKDKKNTKNVSALAGLTFGDLTPELINSKALCISAVIDSHNYR